MFPVSCVREIGSREWTISNVKKVIIPMCCDPLQILAVGVSVCAAHDRELRCILRQLLVPITTTDQEREYVTAAVCLLVRETTSELKAMRIISSYFTYSRYTIFMIQSTSCQLQTEDYFKDPIWSTWDSTSTPLYTLIV